MDDNYVLKSDVCKYLLLNPRIMELFNLAPGSIDSKLAHFSSEKPGCLSFREFCHFLKSPRDLLPSSYYNPDKVDHLSNAQIKELPNTCLLSQETINLMENKFNEIWFKIKLKMGYYLKINSTKSIVPLKMQFYLKHRFPFYVQ